MELNVSVFCLWVEHREICIDTASTMAEGHGRIVHLSLELWDHKETNGLGGQDALLGKYGDMTNQTWQASKNLLT
jgi:hypothetical protein